MTDHAHASDALAVAAARRHDHAHERAIRALRELHKTGEQISFAAVARRASVTRKFLYSQADLRNHIERARTAQADAPQSTVPLRERASDASLRARLNAALEDNKQLREERTELRGEIAVLHGKLREARQRGPRAA
jgi:osmotically-inducible protein OsmY